MTAEVSAGRELDAEVAVRAMGWQRRHADPNTEQLVVAPPGWTDWSTFYWLGRNIYHLVPLYSTSIEAAWQVVERIAEQWAATDDDEQYQRFTESIDEQSLGEPFLNCSASQMALVICRAALAAVDH